MFLPLIALHDLLQNCIDLIANLLKTLSDFFAARIAARRVAGFLAASLIAAPAPANPRRIPGHGIACSPYFFHSSGVSKTSEGFVFGSSSKASR